MDEYKFIEVIFQIPGGRELKYKKDDTTSWQELWNATQKMATAAPDFLFAENYDSHESLIETLIQKNKGFSTYGTFRLYTKIGENEAETNANLLKAFKEKIVAAGNFNLIDNTYTLQLLKVLPGLTDAWTIPPDLRPDKDYYKNLREGKIAKEIEEENTDTEEN